MKVAEKILEQLGGQKFIAMTGANHFVADGNTLRMALPKNASKANRLYITLDASPLSSIQTLAALFCRSALVFLLSGR